MTTNHLSTLVAPDFPVLRGKAVKVEPELGLAIAARMFPALPELKGVGLAAPQFGVGARVAVVEWEEQRFVLINPVATDLGPLVEDVEGCLSLPNRRFLVSRHDRIRVISRLPGGPVMIRADGWLARIFQHEMDHLDGICIDKRGSEVFDEAVAV